MSTKSFEVISSIIVALMALVFGITACSKTVTEVPSSIINSSNQVLTPENQKILPQHTVPQEKPAPFLTLNAVGDIMLSRNVEQTMISENDWSYPFRETTELLKDADITFGNLETPVLTGRVIQTNEMVFRSDPRSLEGLRLAGFDIVSLANNHTPNFGKTGLLKTFEYLDNSGIQYVGAGVDNTQATLEKCQTVEKSDSLNTKSVHPSTGSGYKVCFLAFNDTDVVPDSYFANVNHPGTALMDLSTIVKTIQNSKERSSPDLLIVSMHSGTEYSKLPNKRQVEFAHAAIDAGADFVIGHHPHVLQPREFYKGKWILYSLGNFVFDQMFSLDTRLGAIAHVEFFENTTTIDFIPVQIHNYSQPRPIDDEDIEYQKVLESLRVLEQ